MKASTRLTLSTALFFGLIGSSYALTDAGDVKYTKTKNKYGVVLKSIESTIYLGNNCDAYSPQYGGGAWAWANGGVSIKFEKSQIGFFRQDSPFDDGRCPMEY